VRDRRVFIKTLEGLQPVDVIFRRLDDSFCDPLELRSDSSLGVAGLVEAARAGNVTIANALGSGVIETAAIMPFLPGLCRHLLDEDLMLPSVATWWGGQPAELEYVLEHLDELVVKRAFPTEAREPVFGRKLSRREKSSFTAELRARPDHFVAQEHVALSSAPAWHRDRMEPRPVVFRTYVAAAGDSYANCDHSTTPPVLNVNDFTCFLNKFAAGDSAANCDGSSTAPILNVNDFTCFLNKFAVGCP